MNCWNILRAFDYHNVTGNGKRDGFKKCQGLDDQHPSLQRIKKLREGSETEARRLKCYKGSPSTEGGRRVRRTFKLRSRYSPRLNESLGFSHTDGFRYETLKVLEPGEVYFLGAPANLGAITRRKDLSTAPINLHLLGRPERGWFLNYNNAASLAA